MRTSKGDHPDIDPTSGELKADAYLPDAERAFNRMYADPAARQRFMDRLQQWQSRLPVDVQREIAGKTFGEGRTAYEGYLQYKDSAEAWLRGLHPASFSAEDLGRMSDSEWDERIDERGQVRDGWTYRVTDRDITIDDGLPGSTAAELRNRGAQP